MARAVIFSCEGTSLDSAERELFNEADPFGFILFKRNIDNPDQLKKLIVQLRESVGRDCPILIDQEGGRVQRMGPPHWGACRAARDHDSLESVRETTRAIAHDLAGVGIDVNCAPVLDVLCPDTHDAIGSRAYSDNPANVTQKGRAVCEELLEAGITPVLKHIPGQGRATLDSHHDLPVISSTYETLSNCDFIPFRDISGDALSVACWGMVAHVIYSAIDPDNAATVSPKVIDTIRRDIGFDGLLLSDDISMGALNYLGKPADRVAKMLACGLDIALYCAGKLNDMKEIAAIAPDMSDLAQERYERSATAKTLRRRPAA